MLDRSARPKNQKDLPSFRFILLKLQDKVWEHEAAETMQVAFNSRGFGGLRAPLKKVGTLAQEELGKVERGLVSGQVNSVLPAFQLLPDEGIVFIIKPLAQMSWAAGDVVGQQLVRE